MHMFWGNVYLRKSGFLPEVRMFAEKHCPPMPAPEPFASVAWEGVKSKDPWAPVQTNSESAGLGPRNLDYSTCFTEYRCKAVFEDHGSGPTFLFFLLRRLRPRKVCGLSKDTGLRRGRSRTKINPFQTSPGPTHASSLCACVHVSTLGLDLSPGVPGFLTLLFLFHPAFSSLRKSWRNC